MLECLQVAKECQDHYILSYNSVAKSDLKYIMQEIIKTDMQEIFNYDLEFSYSDISRIQDMLELYYLVIEYNEVTTLNEIQVISLDYIIERYASMHMLKHDLRPLIDKLRALIDDILA